ncbi:MAG: choloylglycine hydrolase [Corallococcus sp.]|nr:choloylglycine hydrolase [Bacillota bacterium]MCM1534118.1 choloylglycine hydrolase [Corallococcus sp.]
MCTAATYKTKSFYFGRTFDYEFSYREEVTVTPRNYPFVLRNGGEIKKHFAMIGVAFVTDIPLYYDAVNEKGLSMAGLNFVGNACYNDVKEGKINLAQFEFIPYVLGLCATVDEAVKLLKNINVTNQAYSDSLPISSLHWIIADSNKAVTVECVRGGMKIYDNPVGVLTNNPPFEEQMFNLNNYMHLSPRQPSNSFSDKLPLKTYSRGMGALGLPGDLSSQSRFVRAAFVKSNSVSGESDEESVNQFFHILGAVDQQRGCCEVDEGQYEITIYTSCCNTDTGVYYYTTYENHSVTAVDMRAENLDGNALVRYPLERRERIAFVNRKG